MEIPLADSKTKKLHEKYLTEEGQVDRPYVGRKTTRTNTGRVL